MSGDHNENQKPTTNDLKECGTCGYPLLPEERTGLVEVNGKMIKQFVSLDEWDTSRVIDSFRARSTNHVKLETALRGLIKDVEQKLKERNT